MESIKKEREIKFEIKIRRKDGTDSYFEYLTLDSLLNRNGLLFSSLWEIEYKRQYTGIKDIEGKEIYEGDIIEYNQHHFNTDLVVLETKIVEFKKDRWNIFETNAGESNIKITGNIYENKEIII